MPKILRNKITPELEYIRELYAAEDALLTEIRLELEARGIAIQVGAEEGRILQLLIALHGTKTILEIGTLAGYSTIWMARALPKYGHIYTINKDKEHIAMAKNFFSRCECADNITMLEGDAKQILSLLPQVNNNEKSDTCQITDSNDIVGALNGREVDMMFIDADKISYNEYLDWAEAKLRRGGLIVADNTLLGGKVLGDNPPEDIPRKRWEAMRRFNSRLADRNRYNASIIPTGEGLTIAIKL